MATDVGLVLANLTQFCDFGGKIVIHVGAGGGQFVRSVERARGVVAVDADPAAMARLKLAVEAAGLGELFAFREEPFEAVADRADIVFFEFCLHEMDEPDAALRHARELAPATVVIDHAPESKWAWYVAETEKAARSWAACERAGIRREQVHAGLQRFDNGDDLLEKVRPQGEVHYRRERSGHAPWCAIDARISSINASPAAALVMITAPFPVTGDMITQQFAPGSIVPGGRGRSRSPGVRSTTTP